MGNIYFLHPLFAVLSFFIGMIFLFLYFKTAKNASKFKFISDIEKVFGKSRSYFNTNLFCIFLLVVLFSCIVGDPHIKQSKTKIIKNGIDIALVVDLSYSMNAEDIKPNRLEVAKQVLSDFTQSLSTDRVGLVLFSGKPFTSVPLTFDYNFITQYIKKVSIQSINQDYMHLQGTAIGDALLYGANLFEKDSDREKVIVLFTDGEANKGIRPLDAVRFIKEKNIKIHTVGIGGDKDTYVTVKNIYGNQKVAIGGIDENNLKTIASLTNGLYYRADTSETFKQIFEKLNLLQKKKIEVDEYELAVPYYTPFIYALFFLLAFFLLFHFYYFIRK